MSKKKEERTKQHQARVIQFFSAVVIGNASASLDFEQQLLRKFRKLNLSIVKVRAKLVHVIFHFYSQSIFFGRPVQFVS